MKNAEKIEALREWAASTYYDESSPTWFAGYACARDEVRNIIDPPKPKWREMVDLAVPYLTHVDPLVVVLESLANVANPRKVTEANLARIVAICEAQVGDGWQADPDDLTANSLPFLIACVADGNWKGLATSSATWLRSLTDGGAA